MGLNSMLLLGSRMGWSNSTIGVFFGFFSMAIADEYKPSLNNSYISSIGSAIVFNADNRSRLYYAKGSKRTYLAIEGTVSCFRHIFLKILHYILFLSPRKAIYLAFSPSTIQLELRCVRIYFSQTNTWDFPQLLGLEEERNWLLFQVLIIPRTSAMRCR